MTIEHNQITICDLITGNTVFCAVCMVEVLPLCRNNAYIALHESAYAYIVIFVDSDTLVHKLLGKRQPLLT